MGLDWKSLPYGHFGDFALNPIKDSKSRRRRSLGPDQSNFLNQHITPSAGDSKGAVPAVVYRSRLTKHKRSNDKVAMMSPENASSFKNYIYNVYYHGGHSHPAPSSEDDPLVATLPEATLDANALSSVSMFGNAANNYDLTSRLAWITFDQPYSQTGARITRVGAYVDLDMYASKLSSTFVAGSTGGGGGAYSSPAPPAPPGVGPPLGSKGPVYTYAQLKPLVPLFKPLLKVIAESESGHLGYDAGNQKVVNSAGKKSYPSMQMSTKLFGGRAPGEVLVSEIMAKQASGELFATGKYQITPDPLKSAVTKTKSDAKKTYYSEVTQDIFGITLLMWKQGRTGMYLTGKTDDLHGATQSLAYEWAGVPMQYAEDNKGFPKNNDGSHKGGTLQRGMSWYEQDGINKAKTSGNYVSRLFNEMQATRQRLDSSAAAQQTFGS